MKVKKNYSLDRVIAKTVNLTSVNPTIKAILRGLVRLTNDKEFVGLTGDQILDYCVKNNLWSTKQDRDKYITTWRYYVNTLKTLGVIEVDGVGTSSEPEYLEIEDELVEEDELENESE